MKIYKNFKDLPIFQFAVKWNCLLGQICCTYTKNVKKGGITTGTVSRPSRKPYKYRKINKFKKKKRIPDGTGLSYLSPCEIAYSSDDPKSEHRTATKPA